jgi:hypothetical protein
MKVGRFERFEVGVRNSNSYADPYRDVELVFHLDSPSGRRIDFWGFHDGGTTWRIRYMPEEIGTWCYSAYFSDGAPCAAVDSPEGRGGIDNKNGGIAGTFECVPSQTPGIVRPYGDNPTWFAYAEKTPFLMRSFHVGDRFFAANWDVADRRRFLDWLRAHGYNTLSVAGFFLNRDAAGRGRGWQTPRLWPLDAGEYRRVERLLDELAARKIVVFPFAGFFGRSAWFPTDLHSQVAYIKYASARIGAYWNLLYNVAGPEPLLRVNPFMTKGEVDKLGYLIKRHDPYRHMLTVHNETGPNVFVHDGYIDYVTLQGPKTTDRATLVRQLSKQRLPNKPLYAQETLWPGNTLGHPDYSIDDIRRNGFSILLSGGTINFADCMGNSSSGFTGSLDPADAEEGRHAAVGAVWDLFAQFPFHLLRPSPELAGGAPCLSDGRSRFLVYLDGGDAAPPSVRLDTVEGPLSGWWIDARNPSVRKPVRRGRGDTTQLIAPGTGDWLLELVGED